MILASGAGPRAIFSRLAPIVVGAGLLAGCQSAGHAPPPEVRADGWRVVERVGEARYLAPGAGSWAAALSATALPDGSRVTTGAGGRLILARATDHVSAGPGSRFGLPEPAAGAALEQTAGRLRYRLAEPRSLAVATPALAIQVGGSVFDVTVGADGTEVAVERGRLRVATLDGEREIELESGQSAHAGGPEALAFRRAHGQPLERVERIILPALQPKPLLAGATPPEASLTIAAAAASQASTSAAASVESAVPIATAGPTAGPAEPLAPMPPAAPPAATEARPAVGDRGGAGPAPVDVEPASTPAPDGHASGGSEAASAAADGAEPPAATTGEDRQWLFDRLTEGMVGALPAQPAPRERSAHGRSI